MKQQSEEIHMNFFSHLVMWALFWYVCSVVLEPNICADEWKQGVPSVCWWWIQFLILVKIVKWKRRLTDSNTVLPWCFPYLRSGQKTQSFLSETLGNRQYIAW